MLCDCCFVLVSLKLVEQTFTVGREVVSHEELVTDDLSKQLTGSKFVKTDVLNVLCSKIISRIYGTDLCDMKTFG